MTDFVTPRINANLRQQFQSADAVRIIGKASRVNGNSCTLDASGEVVVELNNKAAVEVGRFYEVVGKVNDDLSIRALSVTDFGTNIDLSNVDRLIAQQHKYKEIFYN